MATPHLPGFGLFFRRYAPFDTFGFGFRGDGRKEGSTSLTATARTYGLVGFNRAGLIKYFAGTSGTHYHTTVWGDIVALAKVSRSVAWGNVAGPDLFQFSASTAGANPLVMGSPDIDTSVAGRFDFSHPTSLRVDLQARGDNFPNLEVFLVCFTTAHAALLIDGRTTGGQNTGPFTRLPGSHADQPLGRYNGYLALTPAGTLMNNTRAAASIL